MLAKPANPITRVNRRYFIEFALAMLAYVVVMRFRHTMFHQIEHVGRAAQIAVALLPAIPVLGVFLAVLRLVRHTDEFLRRIAIESLAIAGTVTAFLSIVYGLIEGEFIPRPSAWWTWVTFGLAWLISSLILPRRYR